MTLMADDFSQFGLSAQTLARLEQFEDLVRHWNPAINLVSKASLSHLRSRHVIDSLQVFRFAGPSFENWCDLGSGGGFPGIVIAAMAEQDGTAGRLTLVESDGRKAAFLREAMRLLGLSGTVLCKRIEAVPDLQADVVSARALAPLSTLCGYANRHLRSNGLAIFPKGEGAEDEIARARADWSFDLEKHQSLTDPNGVILLLRNIKHV